MLRVGIVFIVQTRLVRLLSWQSPTHTFSFLATYSFLCLHPNLIAVAPIVAVLLFIMVPSYVVRHPPPPTSLPTDSYSPYGPPIAPPPELKPASEISKDFFRNLRDLQNCMEDFSRGYDKVVGLVTSPTNFSNEVLSSAIFLFLFAAACVMFFLSYAMPWRPIILVAGWVITSAGHPAIRDSLRITHKNIMEPRERRALSWLLHWAEDDITLDSSPEMREVEIFEIQRREDGGEWESWVYSPSTYDYLSRERVAGERPKGTRFLEDVQPPPGWEWSDKQWSPDLLSRQWVEERLLTGVEVETEGERWVYDIPSGEHDTDKDIYVKSKTKSLNTWEADRSQGQGVFWRRRRWKRLVKRRVMAKKT